MTNYNQGRAAQAVLEHYERYKAERRQEYTRQLAKEQARARAEAGVKARPRLRKVASSNMVYIWTAFGLPPGVVKVGLTSSHLGEERIRRVAAEGRLGEPKTLALGRFRPRRAASLETKLKRMGEPHSFNIKFSGSTEFRWLSAVCLREAIALVQRETQMNFE